MMSPRKQVEGGDHDRVRELLRSLPKRQPATDLRYKLRVVASKESTRRQSRVTWRELWRTWKTDFTLFANNLMRPLAIPTAGGFLSALLLFGVLAPTLATRGAVAAGRDIPTALYTEASVRTFAPFGFNNESLTVEVTIDGQGRVIDYAFPNTQPSDPELQRSIENYLLFTEFTPVRNFGQPVQAKVRLSFQSSRIDVKG